jgi:methylmalonyl-CoA/ethylmalonyl-CoA epimerase
MIQDLPLTLNHIGVIVGDLDKAIKYCELIGLVPDESPKAKLDVVSRELYGKPVAIGDFKLRGKFANLGPIRIELIQPLEGKSLWGDFLAAKGEGLHHLGFAVTDYEKVGAALIRRGFTLLFKSSYKNGGGSAYFSHNLADFLIEIVQI